MLQDCTIHIHEFIFEFNLYKKDIDAQSNSTVFMM